MNIDFRHYFLIESMARSYQNYEIKTGVTELVLELQEVSTPTQQSIRGPALVLHSFRFLSQDWGEFQNGMHMERWKEALKNAI